HAAALSSFPPPSRHSAVPLPSYTLAVSFCTFSLYPSFFYSSRHHRDLHSFPTRRSSDLSKPLFSKKVMERNQSLLSLAVHQFSPDRKSTRLNSSHVKISYAVFCLKKKNKRSSRNSIGGRPWGAGRDAGAVTAERYKKLRH